MLSGEEKDGGWGLFDLDGDGRANLGGQWLGMTIFGECAGESEPREEDTDYINSSAFSDDDDGRACCEDGGEGAETIAEIVTAESTDAKPRPIW